MGTITEPTAVTLWRLAKDAIDVQDACNLSGVVHSYSKALSELWKVADFLGEGTDWVNTHPVAILYASKVGSLTGIGSGSFSAFSEAWGACEKLVEDGKHIRFDIDRGRWVQKEAS